MVYDKSDKTYFPNKVPVLSGLMDICLLSVRPSMGIIFSRLRVTPREKSQWYMTVICHDYTCYIPGNQDCYIFPLVVFLHQKKQ